MIKAGIIGGAGYTAGELIRILVNHPDVQISFVHSESSAGKYLHEVHEGLLGDTEIKFCDSYDLNSIDVVFMCGGHGKSGEFWKANEKPANLKIIDLAQDFRDESEGYVYGLPEWRKDRIRTASKIANPGCFATAIQLALLPLFACYQTTASALMVSTPAGYPSITGTAITGSTGAGVKPGSTTHFSWRNNNISIYKVLEHQHLLEICRNLASVWNEHTEKTGQAPAEPGKIVNFIPVRGDFARGIFATFTIETNGETDNGTDSGLEAIISSYKEYYKDAPFTFVSDRPVDLKEVVNTNKCLISIEKHGNSLVISSVIDNLLKGASGQAVQNMNLMFGLEETAGLKLKASAF